MTVRSDSWTRDSEGRYVRWNRPPHKVGALLNLVLEGESVPRDGELSKRRVEYMKLAWRQLKRRE